jgi:hypothetical protein
MVTPPGRISAAILGGIFPFFVLTGPGIPVRKGEVRANSYSLFRS